MKRNASSARAPDLTLPASASREQFDFETTAIECWTIVTRQWAVEDMAGAPAAGKSSSSVRPGTTSTSSSRRRVCLPTSMTR